MALICFYCGSTDDVKPRGVVNAYTCAKCAFTPQSKQRASARRLRAEAVASQLKKESKK